MPRPTITIETIREASTNLYYVAVPNFYLSAPSDKETFVQVTVSGSSSSCQVGVDCSYVTNNDLTPTLTAATLDDASDKITFTVTLKTPLPIIPITTNDIKILFAGFKLNFKIIDITANPIVGEAYLLLFNEDDT